MLTAAQQHAIDQFAEGLLALSDDALIDTYHQVGEDRPGSRPNLVRPRTQVSTRVASIRSRRGGTGLWSTHRWREEDSNLVPL